MGQHRSMLIKSVPAIVGLCIVIIMASLLSNSQYYNELHRYGHPICSIDRHKFTSETCEACGREITHAGVFYSMQIAIEQPFGEAHELSFSAFYDSYKAFESDYSTGLAYAVVILIVLIAEVCIYVFAYLWSRKNKTNERRLGRHKT